MFNSGDGKRNNCFIFYRKKIEERNKQTKSDFVDFRRIEEAQRVDDTEKKSQQCEDYYRSLFCLFV